jgi:hypothetical protein
MTVDLDELFRMAARDMAVALLATGKRMVVGNG